MNPSPPALPAPCTEPLPAVLLIDALNLAYWCGAPPSLRIPLSAMAGLMAAGYRSCLYFDASARYRLGAEGDLYEQLRHYPAQCVEVASGRSADQTLLRQARSRHAGIISRDRYRDYRRHFRKLIDDPERLISGSIVDDQIHLAALGLRLALSASAAEAWKELLPRLEIGDDACRSTVAEGPGY